MCRMCCFVLRLTQKVGGRGGGGGGGEREEGEEARIKRDDDDDDDILLNARSTYDEDDTLSHKDTDLSISALLGGLFRFIWWIIQLYLVDTSG